MRPPKAPTPAYIRVANELREGIDRGKLKPGDRLATDADLAAYGVSRNTFREALRLLEAERLVVIFRGTKGGTFVAAPSVSGVQESMTVILEKLVAAPNSDFDGLLDTRAALEVAASEYAAGRRTAAELRRLEAALAPARSEPQTVFACSWRFHSTVLEAAHNPFLKAVTEPVSAIIRMRSGRTDGLSLPFMEDDHTRLFAYIRDQDAAGAANEMRDHLARVRQAWQDFHEVPRQPASRGERSAPSRSGRAQSPRPSR
jgi:DNA-binding FadR family transcriptional regulator